MKAKYWTLGDLSRFCKEQQIYNFSVSGNVRPILVSMPAQFNAKIVEAEDDRFLKIHFKACHTATNLNRSEISEEVMKRDMSSILNCPILADVCAMPDEDGNVVYDFSGHTAETIKDPESGEPRTNFIERVVGSIPANASYELRRESNDTRSYLHTDGLVYELHGNLTADILRRRKIVDCSVEMTVLQMHYDVERSILVIDEFKFVGVTLLGRHVKPGMEGASATVQDGTNPPSFSDVFTSDVYRYSSDDIRAGLQAVNEKLEALQGSLLEYKLSRKGGGSEMTHLQELLTKYEIKLEDLPFEHEGLSDSELDAAFSAAFDSDNVDDGSDGDSDGNDGNSDGRDENDEPEEASTDESGSENDSDKPRTIVNAMTYSVSLDNLRHCLVFGAELIAKRYGVSEGNVYLSEIFLEPQHVIFGAWSDNESILHYRMSYTLYRDGSELTAEFGEPELVVSRYLTIEEDALLSAMQANYSELESEVQQYRIQEMRAQQRELLQKDDYELIRATAAFTAIDIEQFDSIEALQAELDSQLLTAAKTKQISFEAALQKKPKPAIVKMFSAKPTSTDATFLKQLEERARTYQNK